MRDGNMVALPLTHGGRVLFYPFAAAKPADKGGGKKIPAHLEKYRQVEVDPQPGPSYPYLSLRLLPSTSSSCHQIFRGEILFFLLSVNFYPRNLSGILKIKP